MAINFDQNRSGLLGINTGANYNQMAFNPGSLKDSLIKSLYNIEKDTGFSNPKLDELKQEDMQQFKEKGTPLSLPSNAYTAMAISNFDDIFGNKTFTDAFGVNRNIAALNRPNINTAPFNVNNPNVMNQGVTNTNTFRSMLLDDLRNLPTDFKTSLGKTKDAFMQDLSGLKNFATNLKDKGIDLGSIAASGFLNAIQPGLGIIASIFGNLKETPEQKTVKGLYDLDDTGTVKSGLMAGYNPVSAFGPTGLSGAMIDRITNIDKTLNNKVISNRTRQVLEARKAELEAQIAREQAAMKETIERQYRSRPGEYGGPDRQTEREQAGPGYDDVSEAGSFRYGGIASL